MRKQISLRHIAAFTTLLGLILRGFVSPDFMIMGPREPETYLALTTAAERFYCSALSAFSESSSASEGTPQYRSVRLAA